VVFPTEALVGEMSFQFGGTDGPVIKVPCSELFRPADYTWSERFDTPDVDDTPVCHFGVVSSNELADETLVLGDTFLRSVYVLFDLENNQIGIANALWNATDSNIVEIPANGEVGSANPVTGVTVTQTGSRAQGPEALSTATGSNSLVTSSSLPDGVKTTLGTNSHEVFSQGVSPTSSGPAASSASASAAAASLKQSALPFLSLSLCVSIMLIAALFL
jgi:hypothetical protein